MVSGEHLCWMKMDPFVVVFDIYVDDDFSLEFNNELFVQGGD